MACAEEEFAVAEEMSPSSGVSKVDSGASDGEVRRGGKVTTSRGSAGRLSA